VTVGGSKPAPLAEGAKGAAPGINSGARWVSLDLI